MARRSTDLAGSSVGVPCTWQRKPSSAYSSARDDAGFGLAQAGQDFLRIVADG